MANFPVVLMLLGSILNLSPVSSYYSNSERFRDIESKMEKLEARVDRLTREVLANSDEETCPQLEDIPSPLPDNFPSILPLEARREPLPGGELRVSLKFWTVPNVHVMKTWYNHENYDTIPESVSNSLNTFPPGVAETHVIFQQGNTSFLFVEILAGRNTIRVYFNATENTTDSQTCIPCPVFQLLPAGDIVYDLGQDTDIELKVPIDHVPGDGDGGPGSYYTNLQVDPYLVDLPTGGMRARIEEDDFAKDYTSEDFLTHQKISIKLKTSTNYVSGFVIFNLEQPNTPKSLVFKVTRQETVIVRPRSQSGPFPVGYLNFVTQQYVHVSPDGVQHVACNRDNYGMDCVAGCLAVGTGLNEMEIYRINRTTGASQRVTDLDYELTHDNAFQSTHFIANDTSGQDIQIFQCRVNNTQGASAVRVIELMFYDDLSIDRNQTGYRLLNGSMVELTCAINGRSTMDVVFLDTYLYEELPPDNVTSTPYQTIATKVMPMEAAQGVSSELMCKASVTLPGRGDPLYVEHTFNTDGAQPPNTPDLLAIYAEGP